jgi:hypothetical protein
MVPSAVLNVRPAGSAGETLQEVIAPPVEVGVRVAVGSPMFKATRPLAYLTVGTTSLTDRTREKVLLPLELLAVMVYVDCEASAVGVPVMTPVVVLNVRPAGSAGEIE